jgi:[ribosomal protein S5]-alanine N-acetyltransferase
MTNFFLTTNRIGFRQWSQDDLNLAHNLWGDIEVTRFIGGPFSDKQIQERLAQEIAMQTQYGVQYWPIFEQATGEHIGCCGLRPYPKSNNTLEIGFHLRPIFWGKGLAQEAVQATIKFAFISIKVKALFAGHNPKNKTSRHLLTKLGFKYTHDEFYPPTGLNHPSYLLARAIAEV